jgi:hypothetical protein
MQILYIREGIEKNCTSEAAEFLRAMKMGKNRQLCVCPQPESKRKNQQTAKQNPNNKEKDVVGVCQNGLLT